MGFPQNPLIPEIDKLRNQIGPCSAESLAVYCAYCCLQRLGPGSIHYSYDDDY